MKAILLARLGAAAAALGAGLAAGQSVTILPAAPQYMEPVYARVVREHFAPQVNDAPALETVLRKVADSAQGR